MTNRYTYEMTKLAIFAAIAAMAIAMLIPASAHAKATGDTIGAPTKEVITGTTHADMADTLAPAFFYSKEATSTATTTLTRAEKRAAIKELKAEIKHLQKLVKSLSK